MWVTFPGPKRNEIAARKGYGKKVIFQKWKI